jgi:hypothetical protein
VTGFIIPILEARTLSGKITGELIDLTSGKFKSAVGIKCSNDSNDVAIVQQLLRHASIALGSSVDPGRADGIYGQKTAAAIKEYQLLRFKTFDGVISPGKSTIRQLAMDGKRGSGMTLGMQPDRGSFGGAAAAAPLSKELKVFTGAELLDAEKKWSKKAYDSLDNVISMANQALYVITCATNSSDRYVKAAARSLLMKHFTADSVFSSYGSVSTHIHYISDIFRSVIFDANRRKKLDTANGNFLGVEKIIRPDENGMPSDKYIAETRNGGYFLTPEDPITLGPYFDNFTNDHMIAGTILHELIHFIGRPLSTIKPDKEILPKNRLFMGDDLYPKDADYNGASTNRRISVPSPYELFAMEARAGTSLVKLRYDSPNALKALARDPQIDPSGFTGL